MLTLRIKSSDCFSVCFRVDVCSSSKILGPSHFVSLSLSLFFQSHPLLISFQMESPWIIFLDDLLYVEKNRESWVIWKNDRKENDENEWGAGRKFHSLPSFCSFVTCPSHSSLNHQSVIVHIRFQLYSTTYAESRDRHPFLWTCTCNIRDGKSNRRSRGRLLNRKWNTQDWRWKRDFLFFLKRWPVRGERKVLALLRLT